MKYTVERQQLPLDQVEIEIPDGGIVLSVEERTKAVRISDGLIVEPGGIYIAYLKPVKGVK